MDLNDLFVNLQKSDQKVIYYEKGARKEKEYSDMYTDIAHAVSYLKSLSLRQGDRVGIVGKNSYPWMVVDLACICCGYITVPLDAKFTKDLREKIEEYQLSYVLVGNAAEEAERIISFEKVLAYRNEVQERLHPVQIDDLDVFTFNFTSGTSGMPKAIETKKMSFNNLINESQKLFKFRKEDRFLIFLPLNVYLERCYIYASILIGFDIILINPEYVFTALQKESPTVIIGVPYFFENVQRLFNAKAKSNIVLKSMLGIYTFFKKIGLGFMFNHRFPIFVKLWGGKIRYLLCGSAPIKRSVLDFYDHMGLKIYEGYGMNEIGGMVSLNYPENIKYGSVGKAFPGKKISFDEQGQIMVQSKYNANETYYKPQGVVEKNVTYLENNMVATGDVGYEDEEGFIYITGRIKDLIVLSSGIKVHPAFIERKMQQGMNTITDCCIYGDNKPFLTALVVPKNINSSKQEIEDQIRKINEDLPSEQKIYDFFISKEAFTAENKMLTSAFKLNRKEIYNQFNSEFEKLY